MHYSPFNKMFNCGICKYKDTSDCENNVDLDSPLKIECLLCHGNDNKCSVCQGTGVIILNKCPVKIFLIDYVNRFIPYFFEWKNRGEYPDARGRIFQPTKLINAFGICNMVVMEREEKEAKNARK